MWAINHSSTMWLFLLICGPVDHHYLNLPVVDKDGQLVGVIDILKLTYATLEQVHFNLYFNIFLISLTDE